MVVTIIKVSGSTRWFGTSFPLNTIRGSYGIFGEGNHIILLSDDREVLEDVLNIIETSPEVAEYVEENPGVEIRVVQKNITPGELYDFIQQPKILGWEMRRKKKREE